MQNARGRCWCPETSIIDQMSLSTVEYVVDNGTDVLQTHIGRSITIFNRILMGILVIPNVVADAQGLPLSMFGSLLR